MTPEQARELLENGTFQEAMQAVRDQMLDEIANSKEDDHGKREGCYLRMKAVDLVVMQLEVAANGGAVMRAKDAARRMMS